MRGTNTRPAVAHELVRAAVFAQVGADHLGLDFYRIERLTIVHSNDRADHLWHDDHLSVEKTSDTQNTKKVNIS